MNQNSIDTHSQLMLKALNQFGLKLPENSTAVIVDQSQKIKTWISSAGNLPEKCQHFNSEYWNVLCTAEQYHLFVENLFSVTMDLKTLFSLNKELQEHFSCNFADKYSLNLK